MGRGPAAAPEWPLDENGFPVPRTGEDGKPVHDQQFFLAFARPGKDTWNRWRAAHPRDPEVPLWENDPNYIRVTFAGVDFREPNNAGIDFSGFDFGDLADFSGATLGRFADLSGATFGDRVHFNGWSLEKWRRRRQRLTEKDEAAGDWSDERKARFLTLPEDLAEVDASPDAFLEISFSGACFEGQADFSDRKFLGEANFTQVKFNKPPRFADCTGFDRIDFTGARVSFGPELVLSKRILGRPVQFTGWTSESDVAVQLRRLRQLAEDTKNHDFEHDLYIEERKAERGILLAQYWREGEKERRVLSHLMWIAVMAFYALLADYG